MKLISFFSVWICLSLLLTGLNAQVSFTVASSTVSPNNARSTSSQYTIQLNAITTFSTNFDVSVTFTSAFSLSTLTGCQLSINAVPRTTACTLTSASNLISFSAINNTNTINNMTLVFSTNTALYAGSFVASLSYYLPGTPSTTYGSNSAPLTITNAVMGCSFTSNSSVVGQTTSFQLTYSPSSAVSAGSILQVQFPPWSAYNLTNFPSFSSANVCGGLCSIRSPNQAQGFFSEILTYSSLYASASSSNMSLAMVGGRNPASTQPISITVTLLYYLTSSSQPSYMTCTTSYSVSTPNQFSGVSFTPQTQTISDTNPITLVLNLTNPISSISYLSVTYSSDISVSFSYVASNQATVPKTFPITGNSNGFLLGSLTNSTTSFTTLFLVQFFFTNAPYGNYPVSLVFTTLNQPTSNNGTFSVDTITLSYTFATSDILGGVVTATNSSMGATTNHTLTFTTINSLITNSKIIVNLPAQIISTNTSSCVVSVSSTCVLFNSTSFLVNINAAALIKGSTVSVTMNNLINPTTTSPTSTYTLTTYYYNTSTPTDVLSSGALFTASAVGLASGSVTPSSLVVAASTTYTFTFQNTFALPAGSYVILGFPSQFANAVAAALVSFSIGAIVQSGCTMSVITSMQFKLTSCITSNAPSGTTFTVKLANIINPTSTKPTSSLSISTYYNNLLMEYMNSTLGVTLTTATSLLGSSIAVTNSNVNSITTYTFSLNFSQAYTSGSRIIITFPSLITFNNGFSCSSSTSGVSISCVQSTSTVLLVIMNGVVPSSVAWTISNIQNSWYALTSTFSFDTTTSDTTYYYMERGTATVTMQPISLSVSYTPNNQLVLLSASTLTLTITNSFALTPADPSLLRITITLPSQLTVTNTTCATTINGTLCTNNAGSNQVIVSQLTSFLTTIGVTFSALAGNFSTTLPFTITLTYNSIPVASNSAFTVNSYCVSPCQGCNLNASQCTSCLPAPYTTLVNYFSVNNSCLATCPATYFVASGSNICQSCNASACLNCVTTANTCTSCSNPFFLSGSTCVATCPNTFYGTNNTCVPCINNCFNCTSATYCVSCQSPYSLNPDNTCALTCPSGYSSVSAVCTACTSNCLTCSSSPSTCTSCVSPFFLSGSTCVATCPNTFYGSNSTCVNCQNQCYNCTNATYCLSCINLYSLNPDHTCLLTCPSGYVSASSVCILCTNNCLTCSGNSSSCTSCASPYFLSGSTCSQTCPDTYFGNGTLCVVCINQCYNCSSATYCLSCITSFSLNPDHTCQSTCPSGYVSVSSVCTACTANCLTCTGTTSNCTSCSSPYFLTANSCVQTCPNTYYGNNTLCVVCVNQCYNCTSSTHCLSCLSGYSLNPDFTCQIGCPSGFVSISSFCTACSSTCKTCSVSTTNCTSCGTGYIFYNNTCVLACPVGQYLNSNNQCQNCISPCKYCLSSTLCQSCVSNYYFYNGTQCLSTCPAGTFIYITECRNCSSQCQTCYNTATNCTSCFSNTYFYLNACYGTCPQPTYPYQGRCTICVEPCATCLNSALLCSSCISGYLLLNASCIHSCPSSGYVQTNGTCLSCPTNCISCASSIVCNTCTSGYYLYQGGCVTACPSTSPIIVSQTCNGCSQECATCSGSPENCLTCTLYYFKYSYTCVQSCPLTYYSNVMSYTCQSGLSNKIVFFPVLITYLIIIGVTIIFKVYSKTTSFPTVVTSLSGWVEIVISAYLLSLITQTYMQVGLNYALPQALIAISWIFTAAINIVHFKLNYSRLAEDQYVRKWQNINVNYTYFVVFRYLSLFTHCKLFRMIYSKLFGSIHLSLIAHKFRNVFTISTVVTVAFLFLSQVPLLISAFYLAYNKLLKDQVFYTSIECLLIVIFSIIISLIDIHKAEDYFEDTEFMMTKRYLQKVNNDSLNKLEDQYRDKDEGSLDGQKFVGTSGGKFIFSKHDPQSMNEILLQEGSAATDAFETMAKAPRNKLLFQEEKSNNEDPFKSQLSPRSIKSKTSSRLEKHPKSQINIFEPIQQQEAEYYELLKYDEQDFKTAAKIEKENAENESEQEGQLEMERKQEFGTHELSVDNSDNRSMLEYRERKQQWNQIIEHRQKLANQIFNTIDTKELYKELEKIEEPLNQDDYDEQEREAKFKMNQRRIGAVSRTRDLPIEEGNVERQKQKRRRKKKGKRGNKQLQEIYLQRLAEKVQPKKKAIYASSNSYKYEF